MKEPASVSGANIIKSNYSDEVISIIQQAEEEIKKRKERDDKNRKFM